MSLTQSERPCSVGACRRKPNTMAVRSSSSLSGCHTEYSFIPAEDTSALRAAPPTAPSADVALIPLGHRPTLNSASPTSNGRSSLSTDAGASPPVTGLKVVHLALIWVSRKRHGD